MNNIKTYAEHYEKSRKNSKIGSVSSSKYKSLYDITLDKNFLDIDDSYHDIVARLAKKISFLLFEA